MFQPYETIFGHSADFKVRYRFYDQNEGGRQNLPFQGYRSDFWYKTPDNTGTLFIIHPEFEDENGLVILDNNIPVEQEGTARMWIVSKEWRAFHQDNIKPGVKGFFMEGRRKVAECEVIEVIGLLTNPIKPE